MAAKHVQLLNELVPKTAVIGFLANPNNPNLASAATEAHKAADILSLKLVVVNASAERDFDPAFTTLVQQRVDTVIVEVDPFFTDQREKSLRSQPDTRCRRFTHCGSSSTPAA